MFKKYGKLLKLLNKVLYISSAALLIAGAILTAFPQTASATTAVGCDLTKVKLVLSHIQCEDGELYIQFNVTNVPTGDGTPTFSDLVFKAKVNGSASETTFTIPASFAVNPGGSGTWQFKYELTNATYDVTWASITVSFPALHQSTTVFLGGSAHTDKTVKCAVTCTGGQVWNGHSCSCPTGSNWNGSSCVTCSAGTVWNSSTKTCDSVCTNGTVWNGYFCSCPTGSNWNGSSCVTCSAGTSWNPSTKTCDSVCTGGTTWDGASCSCPTGSNWNGSSCVTCAAGSSWDDSSKTCITPTEEPTEEPTEVPTEVPTIVPTDEPTDVPTEVPTEVPTIVPTDEPTDVPTEVPTIVPTDEPTDVPTEVPTIVPTDEPTDVPTEGPTEAPTEVPPSHPVTLKPLSLSIDPYCTTDSQMQWTVENPNSVKITMYSYTVDGRSHSGFSVKPGSNKLTTTSLGTHTVVISYGEGQTESLTQTLDVCPLPIPVTGNAVLIPVTGADETGKLGMGITFGGMSMVGVALLLSALRKMYHL